MTILNCLFNNTTFCITDKIDYIVNFWTLFEFILYFFQCFCRVQAILVDESIYIVNSFDHLILEGMTVLYVDVESP